VITGYVEPSGEDAELARREVAGAVEALDGRAAGPPGTPVAGLLEVQVPAEASLASLASRLALARRTLVLVDRSGSALEAAGREGAGGRSAAFRRLGRPGAAADAAVRAAGRAYVLGGGTIDLDAPQRRYWLARQDDGTEALLQEVAAVERAQATLRAMPRLPFRRPVSLPPRLARAAAKLAEAALLGARVYGLDADPAMVRGALRNFAHLGVRAEAFVEGDSRVVEFPGGKRTFDAILTDPPYGRASASVGAEPSRLVPEVLSRWQGSVRPAGRIVVLSPGGPALMAEPWVEDCRVPVRVHRSLTREFRRYRRAA